MIDFTKVNAGLDENFITSKVSESTIFSQYFGNFELKKIYRNPLRRDKNPSSGFYINKKGRITFHDLATGKKHDAFTFVEALYGLTSAQAIEKIASDFGLLKGGIVKYDKNKVFDVDLEVKKQTLIQKEVEPHF